MIKFLQWLPTYITSKKFLQWFIIYVVWATIGILLLHFNIIILSVSNSL